MKAESIPRSWMETNGRRLDSGPYLSGAFEARIRLAALSAPTEPLFQLTRGKMDGIFNGPRFARSYVDDPVYGVPFLGSTDILIADLSMLPLLSKKQVLLKPELLISRDWTLITCSGTIGRMAYARPEMEGMAGSQHFMRVIPDPHKIPPGYLFSYLSSKYGVPLVISGTYGAIIQHIEPHHIADLPVPRLGKIEQTSHDLCILAADLRTKASVKLKVASDLINTNFGFPPKLALSHRNFSSTITSSSLIRSRLDATYHDAVAQESDALLANLDTDRVESLGIEVGETTRIKQILVSEEHGLPFLSSSEIFRLRYEPEKFLSARLLNLHRPIQEGDILLARSGQVGGIIGRGVWADERFNQAFEGDHIIRLRVIDKSIPPGYLYSYLFLTDVGYRQIVRTAFGSSIPSLTANDLRRLSIPRIRNSKLETDIDKLVWDAGKLRAEAQENEDRARKIVEDAIEETV